MNVMDERGAVVGMRIGRKRLGTPRKYTTVPHFLSQIPPDVTWNRIWTAAVGG
jgi:hypothetical protein